MKYLIKTVFYLKKERTAIFSLFNKAIRAQNSASSAIFAKTFRQDNITNA